MESRLEKYLRTTFPHKDELHVRKLNRINQGNSNFMAGFTLSWREGESILSKNYILRMPSQQIIMEPYLPASEYRLLKALKSSPVPVPDVLLLEEDESIFGKPFLIMEKMEGSTLPLTFLALPTERKKILSLEFAQKLADIHRTDWRGLGLFAGEVPANVEEFSRNELKKCRERLNGINGVPRRIIERALDRLDDKAPCRGELTLTHGDYNLANILHNGERIIAVLDWETACIGDPARDLGWLYPGNALALGLPMDRDDFMDLYRNSGGKKAENIGFHQELAMVKLSITCIQACIALNGKGARRTNLSQLGFTIPYVLNSLCYMVTAGLKALQQK